MVGMRQGRPALGMARRAVSIVAAAVLPMLLAIVPAARAQSGSGIGTAYQSDGSDLPPALPLPTVDDMQRLADNLDYIKHALDILKPAADTDAFDRLDDFAGYTKNFADLSLALRSDIAEHRDPTMDSSHTTEELAQLELEFATSPERLHDYAALGLISDTAARHLGYFSFGAGDIAAGVGTMVGQGNLGNVDAVEKVLDGINKTAWGIYGFAVSGNWDVAQAYSAAADLTAKGARGLTLPMFEELTAKLTGLDESLIGIWQQAQQIRMAHGLSAQTVEEFYGFDASILDRIGAGNRATADAQLGLRSPAAAGSPGHPASTCATADCNRLTQPTARAADETNALGGVRLDRPLTGTSLRGVQINPADGTIILLAERNFLAHGINMRDLAMALWLVFGPQPQDPAFSLDPDDPRVPNGPWLRTRYIPDTLRGHSFGANLFAADLRLKELSFQTVLDPDGKLTEWKSTVPGFQSYAELAMKDTGASSGSGQWARFWIVASQVTARQAGTTLLFRARMAVQARREVPDPKSPTGLRDVETSPASLEARWAHIATDRYDALAVESPAFARVRDMAIAVGIAKSLKAAGTEVDLARVVDLLNSERTRTVTKVNAFSVRWESRSETPFHEGNRQGVRIETQELRLFGGVDLNVEPHMVQDDGAARGVDQAVRSAFHKARPGTDIVRFQYDDSQLQAIALPLLVKR